MVLYLTRRLTLFHQSLNRHSHVGQIESNPLYLIDIRIIQQCNSSTDMTLCDQVQLTAKTLNIPNYT